jgi:hypothetical protein
VEPEVLDPVMPTLQQVADDDAPLAVAPWASYVRTRRYAAVVQRAQALRRAGSRAVPDRAPIGFLPGDDVTPQQEAMVMMAGGAPCGEFCTGKLNGTQCEDEGHPSCSIDRCQDGTCAHTEVGPLEPYSPDPYPLNTNDLTQPTRDALACLQQTVQTADGTHNLTSAFRPQSYQDHLYEIASKWQLLEPWPESECGQLRSDVLQHKQFHNLGPIVARQSNHSAGTAFDMTVTVAGDLDAMACACGLVRDVPSESWHYHYVGVPCGR